MRFSAFVILTLLLNLIACPAIKAAQRVQVIRKNEAAIGVTMIPRVASKKKRHVAVVAYGTEPLKFVFTNRGSEPVRITFAGVSRNKAFHAGDPKPQILSLAPRGKGMMTLDVGCDDGSHGRAFCRFLIQGKQTSIHHVPLTFESLDGE
jgi:hypothetical protein